MFSFLNGISLAVGRIAVGVNDVVTEPADGVTRDAPGNKALGDLIGTIRTWSIIACVIAIIVAAVLWAWGAQSQNAAQATQGKKGVIVAVAAAALIFAAEGLVNWGITFGNQIK